MDDVMDVTFRMTCARSTVQVRSKRVQSVPNLFWQC